MSPLIAYGICMSVLIGFCVRIEWYGFAAFSASLMITTYLTCIAYK